MARVLNEQLMQKLRRGGCWEFICKEAIKDPDLSPEIRDGKLIIYYQKGVILTLDGKKNNPDILSEGYYKGFPSCEIDVKKPKDYFKWAKEMIGNHNKNKKEFILQQRIAKDNATQSAKYLVVDMEYQFAQSNVPEKDRIDKTRIDIVAVEQQTGDIILFELKQGLGALNGKSGVEDHIRKTNLLIADSRFCKALRKDIELIITQKNELGILKCGKDLPSRLSNIKMGIIFISYSKEEQKRFDDIMKGYDILTVCRDFSCTIE